MQGRDLYILFEKYTQKNVRYILAAITFSLSACTFIMKTNTDWQLVLIDNSL